MPESAAGLTAPGSTSIIRIPPRTCYRTSVNFLLSSADSYLVKDSHAGRSVTRIVRGIFDIARRMYIADSAGDAKPIPLNGVFLRYAVGDEPVDARLTQVQMAITARAR